MYIASLWEIPMNVLLLVMTIYYGILSYRMVNEMIQKENERESTIKMRVKL